MPKSGADRRASMKYDALNTTRIALKLNLKTDTDILDKLNQVDNKQGYIKKLIRDDIATTALKIYVANRETGDFICEVDTVEEGEQVIHAYEVRDKHDDCYEPDFYDVVDENHCSLL